jgi:hypothetical protein
MNFYIFNQQRGDGRNTENRHIANASTLAATDILLKRPQNNQFFIFKFTSCDKSKPTFAFCY